MFQDIAARSEKVSVPDWHRQVIAEHLASYQTNPSEGKEWEEFEEQVLKELERYKG